MKKVCISKDWYFAERGECSFQKVDLPHDYAIRKPRNKHRHGGENNGYFDGGVGIYNKYLHFDDSKHTILDIDGAYMCALIKLNENILSMHPYGYTPYLVDLTEHIVHGKLNKIEIRTTEEMPSARWYTGAGIYRDVFLWTGGEIRIEPWDLFVKTVSVENDRATIRVLTDVSSDLSCETTLMLSIKYDGAEVACSKVAYTVSKDGKTHVEQDFTIENPLLWDIGQGNLYTVEATIFKDDIVTDTFVQNFGIRTIQVSAQNGMQLNGKTIKLQGGCIHSDHGALGTAAFPAAEERRVLKLKEVGYNALRISHHPPSLALMEICDREGMILLDEAFDCWTIPKANSGYNFFFNEWWERDLSYMVLRDRSHPCIFTYSIGNEIPESDGQSYGAYWSKKLVDKVKSIDDSRPVLSAVCGFWDVTRDSDPEEYRKEFLNKYQNNQTDLKEWSKCTAPFMEPLDIVGYNYWYDRYEMDSKEYPKRVIMGTETHTINFYKSWKETLRLSNVVGDFTWTAFDNLGEVGTGRSLWGKEGFVPGISLCGYPWRSNWQGDFDLCGFRKPQSYFREAIWKENTEPKIFTTHPMHYSDTFSGTGWHWYDVSESWTYSDMYVGKPITVEVYSVADEIIFELNGKEVQRVIPEEGIARTDITYEKGVLVSKAVKNSKIIGTSMIKTVEKPEKVTIVPEKTVLTADNRDLCYFDIYIIDKNGDLVPDAMHELTAVAEGGELMCIFSGNPKNEDDYPSGKCHAFYGKAVAVVRTDTKGSVRLSVSGKGLTTSSVEVITE